MCVRLGPRAPSECFKPARVSVNSDENKTRVGWAVELNLCVLLWGGTDTLAATGKQEQNKDRQTRMGNERRVVV